MHRITDGQTFEDLEDCEAVFLVEAGRARNYVLTAGFALSIAALAGDQIGVGTTEDLLILRFADVASSGGSSRAARQIRR